MSNPIAKTLPAEWHPQRFVQLTWPHKNTDWAHILNQANDCFTNLAAAIVRFENLLIVCQSKQDVQQLLADIDQSKITFVELPSNDTWARDHGGVTILENGKKLIYDFGFNGWGLKYPANFDNQITAKLYKKGIFGKNVSYNNQLNFILEGGSFESDGQGTLMTTSACLLAENRNNKTKSELEEKLKDLFGLTRILWINHGYLAGDDTDTHVDMLARFCTPDTIAYVKCDDEHDEHHKELERMEKELQTFRQSDGTPYQLLPLPMGDASYDENGERLPVSYANFLIINGAVLLPFYDSPKDEIAKKQLEKVFSNREIIGINCNTLIRQHGSLHCSAMQFV
ncbi:MAG: agmatine deiminase family protein [Prevotellaceae bacterium]|jgi:agmatine/peptidylarginine deiminase|nr:agmatine deiminase family protein [Prevotellaceae bacterium]